MPALATLIIILQTAGLYLFAWLPDEHLYPVVFSLASAACAGLILLRLALRGAPAFGRKAILLLPLALFWALYTWRFLNDAWLDPVPLRYLTLPIYAAFLFAICLPALIAGITLDPARLAAINPAFLQTSLLAAVLVALFRGEDLSGRFGSSTILGPIGTGHMAVTAMIISVAVLLTRQLTLTRLLLAAAGIPAAAILLLKCASRGPVIAALCAIAPMLIIASCGKALLRVALLLALVLVPILIHGTLAELDLNERITQLSNYTDLHQSSQRDLLYTEAWHQFLIHPLLGNSIELQDCGENIYYPHNLTLESFMSVGIIGGSAFLITQALGLVTALWLLLKHRQLSLYAAWHLQAFIYGSTSGALATSYSYWFTLGLMLCTLKKEKNETKKNAQHEGTQSPSELQQTQDLHRTNETLAAQSP